MKNNRGYMHIEELFGLGGAALLLLCLLFLVVWPVGYVLQGCGSWGPNQVQVVEVTRLYVDSGKESSHYMVGTDRGVFEIDNGLFLGVWNADELYSRLREKRAYRIFTTGNRVIGMFYQEYPYITKIEEL